MIKIALALNLLFLFSNVFPMSSSSTPTLESLSKASSDIVVAEVTATKSFEEKNSIYTNYDFVVLKTIKGTLKNEEHFDLTLFGGRQGKMVSIRPGSPCFLNKKRYILFLLNAKKKVNLSYGQFSYFSATKDNTTFFDSTRRAEFSLEELVKTISKLDGQTK